MSLALFWKRYNDSHPDVDVDVVFHCDVLKRGYIHRHLMELTISDYHLKSKQPGFLLTITCPDAMHINIMNNIFDTSHGQDDSKGQRAVLETMVEIVRT